MASLQNGDSDLAASFLSRPSKSQAETPATQLWRAQMLEKLGKKKDAEAILKTMTEQRPDDLETWLLLIRSQAAHGETQDLAATIAETRSRIKSDQPDLVERVADGPPTTGRRPSPPSQPPGSTRPTTPRSPGTPRPSTTRSAAATRRWTASDGSSRSNPATGPSCDSSPS